MNLNSLIEKINEFNKQNCLLVTTIDKKNITCLLLNSLKNSAITLIITVTIMHFFHVIEFFFSLTYWVNYYSFFKT